MSRASCIVSTSVAFFSREALPPAIGGPAIVDKDADLGLELRGSGLYEQGMWSPRLIECLPYQVLFKLVDP